MIGPSEDRATAEARFWGPRPTLSLAAEEGSGGNRLNAARATDVMRNLQDIATTVRCVPKGGQPGTAAARTTISDPENVFRFSAVAHVVASRPYPVDLPASFPTADGVGAEDEQLLLRIEANGKRPPYWGAPAETAFVAGGTSGEAAPAGKHFA